MSEITAAEILQAAHGKLIDARKTVNAAEKALKAALARLSTGLDEITVAEDELARAYQIESNGAPEMFAALSRIKWKSADRDNMEFTATIIYSQMDAIDAALAKARGES